MTACKTSLCAFDTHQCSLHLQQSCHVFGLIRHLFANYILKKDYGDEGYMTMKYEKNPVTVCVESDKSIKILLPLNSEYADSTLPLEKSSREFAMGSSVESADKMHLVP